MTPEALIKDRIRAHGPISVAQYMALALAHPGHGYYMRHDPFGAGGDFITAPEISQIFGEVIGAWLAAQWISMGGPGRVALVELGPGRGTLMADILRATRRVPGFHQAIEVHLVETSPQLRDRQRQALAGMHPEIRWQASFDDIPEMPLLLVANEFFDALPIRQFVYRDDAWRERMVGLEGDRLVFVIPSGSEGSPGVRQEDPSAPLRFAQDGIRETCQPALDIATAIAHRVRRHGGAALIVDYGYAQGSKGDTLQAVKQHQYHDVLTDPGEADLTAHVDFAALAQAARAGGAAAHGPMPQGSLLMRLGAGERLARLCKNVTPEQKSAMISGLERLTSPDQMGDLFKAICIAHPNHPTPEGF